jgi:hypothetical protein
MPVIVPPTQQPADLRDAVHKAVRAGLHWPVHLTGTAGGGALHLRYAGPDDAPTIVLDTTRSTAIVAVRLTDASGRSVHARKAPDGSGFELLQPRYPDDRRTEPSQGSHPLRTPPEIATPLNPTRIPR